MGKIIDPFPADDRDGDLASSSRTELEGTHGQRGRGSYCPNQLICVFSDLPTGLTYFNKDVVFFFFFQVAVLSFWIKCNVYHIVFYCGKFTCWSITLNEPM